MKRRLGAGLEASFRPHVHWGAEFLADRVRICGLRRAAARPRADGGTAAGVPEVATKGPATQGAADPGSAAPESDIALEAAFEGTYAEAEAFARSRGLAFAGLHAAVSHLPFKLEAPGLSAGASEEDIAAAAERLRPAGLPPDALEVQGFERDGEHLLVLLREDALRGFLERLPAPLAGLWDLAPSPLALLPHLGAAPGRVAALLAEEAQVHALFLRDGTPAAYAKAFVGLETARRDPAAFALELKKILVYQYGSKFPGASLDAFTLWRDGEGGEAAAALASLGIPAAAPDFVPALAAVPASAKVAGALALQGLRGGEPLASLSVPPPAAAVSRRLWMRRAGQLARVGGYVAAASALAALLLLASALVFRQVVASKARTWSGELEKWDRFQARRAGVEERLGRMQGLLSQRTGSYASLQRVAALLPQEVWLEAWEAEAGEGGRYVHRLTGYSLAEDGVPRFLARLEDGGGFRSVKLKSTERIKGEKVEKETGIAANRRDLVRFQLVASE